MTNGLSAKKKQLIISISLLILIIIFYTALNRSFKKNYEYTLDINDTNIKLELAKTPSEQYQGLSFRPKICELCGMLFIFSDYQKRNFVMRNMKFPLDIIWIKDDKITRIDANLLPEGPEPLNIYSSGEQVNYVLEVNSGFTDKYNINEGDKIKFNFKK